MTIRSVICSHIAIPGSMFLNVNVKMFCYCLLKRRFLNVFFLYFYLKQREVGIIAPLLQEGIKRHTKLFSFRVDIELTNMI